MNRDGGPVHTHILLIVNGGGSCARLRKLLIGVAAVIGVLAVPVAASAYYSVGQAREALIRARLTPRPLYPDTTPGLIAAWNSASFSHGHFFAWKGSSNTNPEWFSISYHCWCGGQRRPLINLTFSRGPLSDIAKAIHLSQTVQQRSVSRVRLGGARRYRFHMVEWYGYMWKQQGFAYSVFSRYSHIVGWALVRHFVNSLYPLGQLWTGKTSQGTSIQLYRSGGGLDLSVLWNDSCRDGSRYLGDGWEPDRVIRVNSDGSFARFETTKWKSGHTLLREPTSVKGQFPLSPSGAVTGSLVAHMESVHHPGNSHWNCSADLTWQVSPFSPGI